jgi:hypothetical protein
MRPPQPRKGAADRRPYLVAKHAREPLALRVNDRGFTLADRNLAFTGATSDAKGKESRTEENQDFFHDDATRVYPLNASTCTRPPDPQLVHESHTPHFCASPEGE